MNWTNSGLFRPISDRIELNRPVSSQIEIGGKKKKRFAMEARAATSTAAWCVHVCRMWMRHPWRRTHAFPE